MTITALVLLFGAFVLVDGIMILGSVITKAPGTADRKAVLILEGVLGVAAGLITLVWPDITGLVLLYLIALWALVMGIVEIAAAFVLRGAVRHDWVIGVVGVLSVLFGIALMITPGAGALIITWLIGWYALLSGVMLLYVAWKVHHAEPSGGAIGQARPLPT
jgi:uncharacterized membrane protein HdeD (DUF308 family)